MLKSVPHATNSLTKYMIERKDRIYGRFEIKFLKIINLQNVGSNKYQVEMEIKSYGYEKTELYSMLWEAYNKLRGGAEPARYVEACEDIETYKWVFKMIFDAFGQSQHYKMMTGQRIKS